MNKPTINTIENQREFCKLFKIKIPVYEHFDYYINLLYLSGEQDIYRNIEAFNEYVKFVEEDTEYSSVVKYKLDYALPVAVEFIKGTEAYSQMQEKASNLKTQEFRSKDQRKNNIGSICLSIDMISANYSCLCHFDQGYGEFSHFWSKFLLELDIHPFLARSKSFRQYVFGNTNPKMFSKIQREFIWELRNQFLEEDIVFVSHDEIILKTSSDLTLEEAKKKAEEWSETSRIPLRFTLFYEEKCESTGVTVRNIMNWDGAVYKRQLIGVEGSKTFWALKRFILQQEIDPRDLLFKQNDSIATWVLDDQKAIMKTLTVRKRGFEEVLNDKLPDMDEETKRKVVSLAVDFFQSNYNKDG